MTIARLRIVRVVAGVVAVLSLLSLAALALSADIGEIDLAEGIAVDRPTVEFENIADTPASTSSPEVALGTPAPPPPAPAPPSPVPTSSSASPAPSPTDDPAPDHDADEPDEETDLAPCALGFPPPKRSGGLASLTLLIPAFGPFAAEAFAFAPAYEPVVEMFGPFLPLFADMLAANEEFVTPAIALLRQLEQAGFDQIEPIYGPYRQDFLDAATQLAETLAPYSEQLRDSPAGVCLIALQGLVADNA